MAWTGVSPLAAAAAGDGGSVTEAERALEQAQESGEQVEVVGQRTENTTTFANPDGFTFTLDQSTVPVRVARQDGSWAAPDASLEARSDGTLAPRAAVVDLVFSGGGSTAPLVSIGHAGRAMSLTWPGTLPVPTVDGDSAVYADVFPGVDLRLTATAGGYREVLVVKTPAAAADPRVGRIEFGMSSSGLDVRSTAGGGLSAVGNDGQEVFTSPPAQMWDSHADTTGSGQARAAGRSAESAGEDPASSAEAPGPGAGTASAPMDISDGTLTVVPDHGMLSTADADAFPLYIDPDVALSSGAPTRTLLRSDGYSDYAWDNDDSDGNSRGKGDGHCGTWNGYYCGPGYTQRLYFQFTPGSLKGKKVLKATFRVTSPWAFQCAARTTDLERTNNISSSTTWSSRPKELDLMVDRSFSAGRGSACDPDSPAAPIEFTDNPAETNENLTPTVADFAAGKFAKLTLELRAHDESDTSAWKRFKNNAVLSVNFVGLPALPTKIGVVAGSGTVCSTSSSSPSVISDPTPALSAVPQTAAGGESGARLRVVFSVDKYTASTSTWASAFGDLLRPSAPQFAGDNVPPGSVSAPTLTDGTLYRYAAWTRSYQDDGTTYLAGPSNASTSGYCYFKIDSTAPKAPTVTFTTTYTECLPNACVPGGGPGISGKVTFAAAAGETVTAFEYKLSPSDTWVTLGAGVTSLTVKPPVPGTYRLDVRGKDSLGRPGAETVKDFVVAAGSGPVGQWHFDENSGAALDSSSTVAAEQDNATLSPTGATRDNRGRRGEILHDAAGAALTTPVTDKGLLLNGTSGYAASANAVIDARASYTVSTWVRLGTSTVRTMGIVSQQGTSVSPFFLSYAADGVNDWSIRVYSCPTPTTCAWNKARSTVKPVPGAWTHLVAEYDATAGQLSLYVNGAFQASVPASAPNEPNGPLQFGRDTWGGNPVDYFDGSIDETRVWQRALTPEEITAEAHSLDAAGYGNTELVAAWNPAGGSGTTLTDTTSGYGRTLTLTGGATLDGDAVVLNGTNGSASTSGSVVDDLGSFTVTARAQLDETALLTKPVGYTAQVAGQRSASGASWGLWFKLTGTATVLDDDANIVNVPEGQWLFGRVNTDGSLTGAASPVEALSGTSTDVSRQITGVFDAQSTTASLYLGDIEQSTQSYTAVVGSGDFTAGRGYVNGVWGNYLPGRIEEIRVWSGAMTDSDQIGVVVGD
ncbi:MULTISPECIES: LamG domain-containing protein [unclassified Streptomyces]|uniref:LamG domain-containing protein n=1 Tax=unclassified Streptomyces TaxID=2593676 RepID=UPI002E2BAEC7|nr:LamG domain-containing protein [Streptomyces sp. NBC_00223]